jgi:predicted Zn-dependent protease
VISRGLLDVLPDEASLAAMLAQELASIIVTKSSSDQWGFSDTTIVSTVETLSHFSFKDNPEQVQITSSKALELLKNSPYKDKLGTAGLFLK